MSDLYSVAIEIRVHDKRALYDQALKQAVDQNSLSLREAREMLGTTRKVNVDACLRMILDPGVSPDGTEINESTAELLS